MVYTVNGVVENGVAPKPKQLFGVRHLQAALLFTGLIVAYMMRVNMSVAIVAMTANMSVAIVAMTANSSSTDLTIQHFEWNRQTQDTILSSFFMGYWVLQIPAGVLLSRVGGRVLIAITFGVNSIITLILPLAAVKGGWLAVCACRVIQGLTQGFFFPTVHGLIGKWAPPSERGSFTTYIYAGGHLGTVIELILAGYLGNSSWGWPAIFYSAGVCGTIWTLFWIWLGANSPATSSLISTEERDYIQTSLGQVGNDKKLPVPWGKVLTSLPFYALLIAHCGQNYGFWTLLTEMPTYMSNVLKVDVKSSGLFSALPYFTLYLLSFVVSSVSAYIVNKGIVTVTTARKIFNSIGHWGPAIALIGLSYSPANNFPIAVILLTITVAINAGHYVGYQVVHIDMAPNFASTLMGITNCIANIVSCIAPLSVGLIISDDTLASEWRKVFFTASAVYFLGNLIFIIFGSCEEQTWSRPDEPNFENGAVLTSVNDRKTREDTKMRECK